MNLSRVYQRLTLLIGQISVSVLLFAFSCSSLQAQSAAWQDSAFQTTAKNFVYVEALGSGGLYSVSYDRLLSPTWSARVGFSTFGFTLSNLDAGVATLTKLSLFTVPITTAYMVNFPDSPHHIELGGGVTLLFGSFSADVSNMGYSFTSLNGGAGQLLAAYRFQPKDGGFSIRAAFTPFYLLVPTVQPLVLPWGGVSFGGTFGGF